MKSIAINVKRATMYAYSFVFTYPTKIENGVIVGYTSSTTCRESLVSYIASRMRNKALSKVCLDKSRILIGIGDTEFKKKRIEQVTSEKALAMVNIVEEQIGMPKTTVYAVDAPNLFMFEGNINWFRSSYTISLWLLLLRIGIMESNFKATTFNELKAHVTKHSVAGSFDMRYAKSTIHCWLPLMHNLDKLFPKKWVDRFDPKKVLLPQKSPYAPSLGVEGIYNLATGTTLFNKLELFKELCK